MAVYSSIIQGNDVNKNQLPTSGNQRQLVQLRGSFGGQPNSFSLNEDILSKHMVLVGSTGCGKTNLFNHIISQIKARMTNDDVAIIFDSKGDFYNSFYNDRTDVVIGNSEAYYDKSKRWNIFKEIAADGWDERNVYFNTQEICRALFDERAKKTKDPFFPNAARDLLASLLVLMFREAQTDKSFPKDFFYNNKLIEYLNSQTAQDFIDILEAHPDMRSIVSYIEGQNSQSQGVLSEMYSIIREVLTGVFAEKGMFSIRNFIKKRGGRTLFIEYDLSIGSVLTPMYKLLIDLALKEALGRSTKRGNVYIFCDEFKLVPNLVHIDDAVNFGRSLGVKVFAGLQSIEQLYEIYGKERGNNLLAGFSSIFAFRANDVVTRNYISDLFGKNRVLEKFQTTDNKLREEIRIGNTVEDWDLNSLRVGEAVVGLPFGKPFKFYFNEYK